MKTTAVTNYYKKPGFTMVELMLALGFFSFILMFVIGGFVLISRNYNRGITYSRVHQAGRSLTEQIVRELRSSSTEVGVGTYNPNQAGKSQIICYSGGTFRIFETDEDRRDNRGVIVLDTDRPEDCSDPTTGELSSAGNPELYLLDPELVWVKNVQLTELAEGGLFRLTVEVASATISDSSLSDDGETCNVGVSGNEFCRVVSLSTVFSARKGLESDD